MRIMVGSDEHNRMTDVIIEELQRRGFEVLPIGPLVGENLTWPLVARRVAEAVAKGDADEGIVCCWTGTGVCMAANKVPGIRAALCDDAETAKGARLWNDANILCLSLRRISENIAVEILGAWYSTSYQPNEEDDASLKALRELEHDYLA